MEELVQDENKTCGHYLETLRTRYGETNPIIIRRDKVPGFAKLDEDWCAYLQEKGWGRMEPIKRWIDDENQVPRQFDVTALHLLDPALKHLEDRKVTVEEHIDRKVTVEPAPEKKKQRIDYRGRAGPIAYARMKDLVITASGALHEMSDPNPKYQKGAVMYLRLALNVRGEDLEKEQPELYQQIVERLNVVRPMRP